MTEMFENTMETKDTAKCCSLAKLKTHLSSFSG